MAIVRAISPLLQYKISQYNTKPEGWLLTFLSGTKTPVRTYKNPNGEQNETAIHLNYRGECDVWLDSEKTYRFELWNENRTRMIWRCDNVTAPGVGVAPSLNTDVIKWSDVLAVQDSDYSGFTARIAADIGAGIAPVVLDDVNGGAVAVLDNVNAGGALFRTTANCNERDVMFTNYVITDVAVSRTTNTKNLLFKNSSNAYGTDANGFVEVKNNRNGVYTYTGNTGGNSLDFLADFDSNTAVDSVRFSAINPPNFAVKIVSTAASDGTVNVYKKQNGLYTPLMPSVAGGTTVEAGKTYQLTCVGDCWTLAEFEEPEQGMLTMIGGKLYNVIKIGSLYWMAENLDLTWEGLTVATGSSSTEPMAVYPYNDRQNYGQYGLMYNQPAVNDLANNHSNLLDGWRVPTHSDLQAIVTSAGGVDVAGGKLKSTSGWTSHNGTDDYGFNGEPVGRMNTASQESFGTSAFFRSVDGDTIKNRTLLLTDDNSDYNKAFYDIYINPDLFASLRLCRDA